MIDKYLSKLVSYALNVGLIELEDTDYAINRLLDIFGLDGINFEMTSDCELDEILEWLCDYAQQNNVAECDRVTTRDLFDTKIMGVFMPRPSDFSHAFYSLYRVSPKEATDYFYAYSKMCNYIRCSRVKQDLKWSYSGEYELDISINLSKPEKDPKDIAAALKSQSCSYPKCQLCKQNVGYRGRLNHPARQNLRAIPIYVGGEQWFFQYSPYVYYNEHCIVFSNDHTPMKIDGSTVTKLLDFVEQFPHYTIGSNADLPIVGGSILTHEHFLGGNYLFPLQKSECVVSTNVDDIKIGVVKWPMSVVRISSVDRRKVELSAQKIIELWKGYSSDRIINSSCERHNTITPICYFNGEFVVDLILRNNITSSEHPLGVFHPHAELHHIKKENIGLIEAMGLAILPGRLKGEIEKMKVGLLNKNFALDKTIEHHHNWLYELEQKYTFTEQNVDDILKHEIGAVFEKVLSHCGVFNDSKDEFENFMTMCIEQIKKV